VTLAIGDRERDVVMMARALVAPDDNVAVIGSCPTWFDAISPACAELVADALRPLWPSLWRRGGARAGVVVRGDTLARGRPWERAPVASLVHTTATLDVLRWLVVTRDISPTLDIAPLGIGDEVVIYLALELADTSRQLDALARQPLVRASPLAWLGFAHAMTGEPPPFDELVTGAGAVVVDVLARELAERWRRVEMAKRTMTSVPELVGLGHAQDAVLDGFMAACDRHRRRDLAGFVLDAAAPMLARDLPPFPDALDRDVPLAVRAKARVSAGALLRAVVRWIAWDQQHRDVRFIDDDYAVAQHLLARVEAAGPVGKAVRWLDELASLAPGSAQNGS